jgi:hypothetical protein
MNSNYAKKVKEDIDKLFQVRFIYVIDNVTYLGLIVIVPKINGSIRVCVDYKKLNASTKKYPFLIPFTYAILDVMARHEMYTFLDGFKIYNR